MEDTMEIYEENATTKKSYEKKEPQKWVRDPIT